MHNLDSVELILSSLDPDIDPGPHHLRPNYDEVFQSQLIYWITTQKEQRKS